ncbi:Spondin-1 [Acropora cervicornis]|uniref:Spondin-1 n=1 Tax=Acropora cervicornis TaxID=6130 RepID=A0AAD9QHB0_ACRCE|nr:Spondin-1 [Acropora cervicornis]
MWTRRITDSIKINNSIITYASCGGNTCPSNLRESRLCYGSRAENCQLSSWSEWSVCPAIRCGSSAMQTSTRQRITTEKCGGWCTTTFRKRRWCFRRPVNCKLSSWSEWNTCNGTVCTAGHGTQVSFRHKIITETCGGTCPSTFKTRSCFNFINRTAVECQVSPWSEWGDCKRTSCQLEGIQTKTRNKTVKEECQGTCKYALLQTKLCTQSQLPCFNGGKYKPNITGCVCVQGYYGVCCEKSPYFQVSSPWNKRRVIRIAATSSGGIVFVIVVSVCYKRFEGLRSSLRSCLGLG